MKSAVKTLVLTTIIAFHLSSARAQIKLTPPSPIANDIRKVIEDYPGGFANITGEMIMQNTQSTEYQCILKVHGAEESSITRFSSASNNKYSWEALMLSTESFEKAKQKFRSLYSQLNKLSVQPAGENSVKLIADYEAPEEARKFTSVVFSFTPSSENLKKLKAEISMQYELTEWKVKLLVYDRDREDQERGKITEE